jgi:hypothetical protein
MKMEMYTLLETLSKPLTKSDVRDVVFLECCILPLLWETKRVLQIHNTVLGCRLSIGPAMIYMAIHSHKRL